MENYLIKISQNAFKQNAEIEQPPVPENLVRSLEDVDNPMEFRTFIAAALSSGEVTTVTASKIEKMIGHALKTADFMIILLGLEPENAQRMLNLLEMWMNWFRTARMPELHAAFRNRVEKSYLQQQLKLYRCVFYIFLRLAKVSGLVPSSLHVSITVSPDESSFVDRGGYGEVLRATLHQPNDVVVKRSFVNGSNAERERNRLVLVREALVWSQLHHPRVLPFFGIENNSSQSPHTIGLVSPYMTNGNLRDWITRNRESYDTKVEGYNLLYQIADGLAYLHSQKVYHCDIKTQNIFVDQDNNLVIGDFGLAVVGSTTTVRPTKGSSGLTYNWAAPELFSFNGESQPGPIDVYGFGLLCYALSTRREPFANDAKGTILQNLRDGKRPSPLPNDKEATLFIQELMKECWAQEPSQRPTMDVVFQSFHRDGLPFGQKSYRFKAKAKKRYEAQESREMSYQVGDVFEIQKIYDNYWYTNDSDGSKKRVNPEHFDAVMFLAKAVKSFHDSRSQALSFSEGELIGILAVNGPCWLGMDQRGVIGTVPPESLRIEDMFDKRPKYAKLTTARFSYIAAEGMTHEMSFSRDEKISVNYSGREWCLAQRCEGDQTVQIVRSSYLRL